VIVLWTKWGGSYQNKGRSKIGGAACFGAMASRRAGAWKFSDRDGSEWWLSNCPSVNPRSIWDQTTSSFGPEWMSRSGPWARSSQSKRKPILLITIVLLILLNISYVYSTTLKLSLGTLAKEILGSADVYAPPPFSDACELRKVCDPTCRRSGLNFGNCKRREDNHSEKTWCQRKRAVNP